MQIAASRKYDSLYVFCDVIYISLGKNYASFSIFQVRAKLTFLRVKYF